MKAIHHGTLCVLMAYGFLAPANEPPEDIGGEVVQGVQVRLYEPERSWSVGEPIMLRTAIRNDGNRNLSFILNKEGRTAQVEVNGRWYEFEKYAGYRFREGSVSSFGLGGGAWLPFGPGLQHDDLDVVVADSWYAIPEGKVSEHAMRRYGGSGWATLHNEVEVKELLLTPGQYRVRIAYTCPGRSALGGQPVRVVSNPIHVEIIDIVGSESANYAKVAESEALRLLKELEDLERSHLEILAAKRLFKGVDQWGQEITRNKSGIEDNIERRMGVTTTRLAVFGKFAVPFLRDKLQELPATYPYSRGCIRDVLDLAGAAEAQDAVGEEAPIEAAKKGDQIVP